MLDLRLLDPLKTTMASGMLGSRIGLLQCTLKMTSWLDLDGSQTVSWRFSTVYATFRHCCQHLSDNIPHGCE